MIMSQDTSGHSSACQDFSTGARIHGEAFEACRADCKGCRGGSGRPVSRWRPGSHCCCARPARRHGFCKAGNSAQTGNDEHDPSSGMALSTQHSVGVHCRDAGIPFDAAVGKELGHGCSSLGAGASAANSSVGSARSASHVRRKGGRIERSRCRRAGRKAVQLAVHRQRPLARQLRVFTCSVQGGWSAYSTAPLPGRTCQRKQARDAAQASETV